MIADCFTTFDLNSLGEDFAAAFAALKEMSAATELGKYEISDRVYINVMEYDAVEEWNPVRLEAHREYADIQVVFSGREAVAWVYGDDLPVIEAYNPEADVLFRKADPAAVSKLELIPGHFAIFYPQDCHYGKFAPASGPCKGVRKAVAKIKLN